MQARGGRRHGAALAGEDGLVAGLVGDVCGALDIRRQRQAAMTFDEFQCVVRKAQPIKLFVTAKYFDVQSVFQNQE